MKWQDGATYTFQNLLNLLISLSKWLDGDDYFHLPLVIKVNQDII